MEQRESAFKAEKLSNEIEGIKANMESIQSRLGNIPEGPVRTEFEKDLADMKAELAAREKNLADALKDAPPR
jgi:hypothetical protein